MRPYDTPERNVQLPPSLRLRRLFIFFFLLLLVTSNLNLLALSILIFTPVLAYQLCIFVRMTGKLHP